MGSFSRSVRKLLFTILLFSTSLQASETHLNIVRDLAAFGPRVFGTDASLKAAEYIRNQFTSYGIQNVKLQPVEGKLNGFNVVAIIPGKDPSKQIIIGSHHDSVPKSPGAYDDAGGTSILLNVAKHFVSMQPPYTLVLCTFDGEEAGFDGSITYAKSLSENEKKRTLYMLCLEMMGWEPGSPNIQTLKYAFRQKHRSVKGFKGYGLLTPAPLAKLILKSARSAGISFFHGDPYLSLLYQIGVRVTKVRFYGDDISFQLSGIPAVMFTDSSFSSFYPHYHQPEDRPENLNEKRLLDMTRLIVTIIHRTKSEDFGQRIDSKSEQEYLTVGPLFLSHSVMRGLYFLTLALLIWHLIRRYGKQKLTVLLLIEALLLTNLFNHYAVFAFVVFGISMLVYLICEWANLRTRWRNAIIFLPHIAVATFAFEAWRQHFLYGTYITPLDLFFLTLAILLSIIRVNKLKLFSH